MVLLLRLRDPDPGAIATSGRLSPHRANPARLSSDQARHGQVLPPGTPLFRYSQRGISPQRQPESGAVFCQDA
jgi:hypothetical protein